MSYEELLPDRAAALSRIAQFALGAALLTWGFLHLTPNAPGVHYVQYRAAADLLMTGRDPYDIAEQSRLQRAIYGAGLGSALAYNYPPWFALACAPLSSLPYRSAEVFYLFVTSLCLFVSGSLLHAAAPGLSRWATIMVVVGFLPSLFAAQTSQTAPLVLFLSAVSWRSLDRGRDRLAGFVLAWLTIKPQLSVGIFVGVMIWSARRRRWGVVQGCSVTLFILCILSTIADPRWPAQMHQALSQGMQQLRPEVSVTWPSLLRVFGLAGWQLVVASAALAITAMAIVVRSAWDRSRNAGEVIGLASIAAFAIAPYAQFYDFPILLVPLFGLVGNQQPSLPVFGLLLAFLVLPYANFFAWITAGWPPCTFAWVPVILAIAWLFHRGGYYYKDGTRLSGTCC
jgi:Glycosyltransferase family 87